MNDHNEQIPDLKSIYQYNKGKKMIEWKKVYRLLLSLGWLHPHPSLVCSRPSVHFLLAPLATIEGEADDWKKEKKRLSLETGWD